MNMRIKIAEMEKKNCVGFIIIFLGTWCGHYGSLLYIYIYIYIYIYWRRLFSKCYNTTCGEIVSAELPLTNPAYLVDPKGNLILCKSKQKLEELNI